VLNSSANVAPSWHHNHNGPMLKYFFELFGKGVQLKFDHEKNNSITYLSSSLSYLNHSLSKCYFSINKFSANQYFASIQLKLEEQPEINQSINVSYLFHLINKKILKIY